MSYDFTISNFDYTLMEDFFFASPPMQPALTPDTSATVSTLSISSSSEPPSPRTIFASPRFSSISASVSISASSSSMGGTLPIKASASASNSSLSASNDLNVEGSSHKGRHLNRGEQLKRNAACIPCRKRRTKCDAGRPHCSACVRHFNYLKKTQPDAVRDAQGIQCRYDEDAVLIERSVRGLDAPEKSKGRKGRRKSKVSNSSASSDSGKDKKSSPTNGRRRSSGLTWTAETPLLYGDHRGVPRGGSIGDLTQAFADLRQTSQQLNMDPQQEALRRMLEVNSTPPRAFETQRPFPLSSLFYDSHGQQLPLADYEPPYRPFGGHQDSQPQMNPLVGNQDHHSVHPFSFDSSYAHQSTSSNHPFTSGSQSSDTPSTVRPSSAPANATLFGQPGPSSMTQFSNTTPTYGESSKRSSGSTINFENRRSSYSNIFTSPLPLSADATVPLPISAPRTQNLSAGLDFFNAGFPSTVDCLQSQQIISPSPNIHPSPSAHQQSQQEQQQQNQSNYFLSAPADASTLPGSWIAADFQTSSLVSPELSGLSTSASLSPFSNTMTLPAPDHTLFPSPGFMRSPGESMDQQQQQQQQQQRTVQHQQQFSEEYLLAMLVNQNDNQQNPAGH